MNHDANLVSSLMPELDTGLTDDPLVQTRCDQWMTLAQILMPPRSPDTSPHEYRVRILSEIHSIDHVLRRARELLNDNCKATLALPSELLDDIFYHICDVGGSVFNVTAVCRRWRAVALGSARLWTRLNTASLSPRLFDLALSRAGSMPLHISIDAFAVAPRLSLFAHAHAHRIASLCIDAREQTCDSFHAPFFKQHLPALRELDINIRLRRAQWDPHGGWFRCLDAPDAPELASLRLCGSAFAWDAPLYDSLKHLTLLRIEKALVPSAADINALFERMRRLETLELDYVDMHVPPQMKIALPPKLRELVVRNALNIDFAVAVVPRDGLHWDVSINGPVDSTAVAAFLRRNAPSSAHALGLALQPTALPCAPGMYAADLRLWTQDTPPLTSPHLRLALRTDVPAYLLDDVCLDQLLTATLGIASPTPSTACDTGWGALFRRALSLRTLNLRGFALERGVACLCADDSLLPELRRIVVEAGKEREHSLRAAREVLSGWLWRREQTGGMAAEVSVSEFLADD
ncbi:hypothetical protein K488DRAFT_82251 [Vararia minispora EC-137]|uniref:Uncharacterized protein n=1 Tax=Vararia minispora EC-137 TaxID=1314806 RepID=A0ACB8QWU4_9AGAM|nr:hypothetical protein K488DRAFT_82251 [Vararia minispora EC-137]